MSQTTRRANEYSWFRIFVIIFFVLIILFRLSQAPLLVNIGWVLLNKGMAMQSDSNIERGQLMLENVVEGESKQHYLSLADAYLSSENLVANGSFEYFQRDWVMAGANGVSLQFTDSFAYTGENSLNLSFLGEDVNFYQTFQEVDIMPEACYVLQAQVKTEEMADGIALEVWDAVGGYQNWYGGRTNMVEDTLDWQPATLNFCVADDIETIQIRIRRYGGAGTAVSGMVWIDNVSLKQVVADR